MKFRARMTETMAIRRFYHVLTTMAKLSKTCVLRLTKEKLFFIVSDSPSGGGGGGGSPCVWCEMDQSRFFSEYHQEGVTAVDNEIFLELEADVLAKNLTVLKSGTLKSLKARLTRKRDTPCLSFEIELCAFSSEAGTRICTHDFPVSLIPRKQWADYGEPVVTSGGFDVSLYLPERRQLKHVAEKYKSLGNHVVLRAARKGELKLSLENERVTLATYFKNLDVPNLRAAAAGRDSQDLTASVRVDLKKFALFLSADATSSKRVLANFLEGKLVHFFVLHDDMSIQYLIPSVLD